MLPEFIVTTIKVFDNLLLSIVECKSRSYRRLAAASMHTGSTDFKYNKVWRISGMSNSKYQFDQNFNKIKKCIKCFPF